MTPAIHRMAKTLILSTLSKLQDGFLRIHTGGESHELGDAGSELRAEIRVHDERFFTRALFGGDIAFGESYMDGDWSADDLVAVVRIAARNMARVEQSNGMLSSLRRLADTLRHRFRANSIAGSRRNIHQHYDLSNDFFRLFLDREMVYSCGWFLTPEDTLEEAQREKLDRICRKLHLAPGDRLLEIGTGWGAFAIHAARNYGCRVTTTTISREQFALAKHRIAEAGLSGRIQLLMEDYRHLQGQFDKIVSIEMFEAVGFEYYDTFFRKCDELLAPDGTMVLQTITMLDQKFHTYRNRTDWIQKHIFPGSELASLSGVLGSLARTTRMAMFHAEDMGAHYARTLAEWRSRFLAAAGKVRALGFDESFIHGWDYYLAYCEGGFRERHVSDVQLLLTKTHNTRDLFGEPWGHSEAPVQQIANA